MKINQLKAGSMLSYLQMALGVIVGLIYTPMMIRLLGKSEYGLYNTVSSTISMMSVLSLGFNSSYIRFYSKYGKDNDTDSIYRLNAAFLMINVAIAAVVLLCGTYISFNLHLVFDEGLTDAEYKIARVLMLLLTANLALSFGTSAFSCIISAHERFIFLKLLGIGKTLVGPLVTLPLLLMGYRSIAMVTVTVVVSTLVDISYMIYVLGPLKQRFVFGKLEPGLFRSLFIYTAFIAVNLVVNEVNWSLGKVLLGRFNGTEAVAIYAVGYTLYTYYQTFSTSISGVFTPRIHRIITQTESTEMLKQQLTSLFIKVGRIQFLILALVASGVYFFGKPFILNIWAGEGYEDSYLVAILLIFSSSIALIQNVGIEIQRAQYLHRFRSVAYAIMAVANIGMTVLLCPRYGAVGAAIGTTVSLILANGLIMNIYYHCKCNLDITAFWKSILRLAVGLIPPVIVGVVMGKLLDYNHMLWFGVGIVVYCCVYAASMWLLGMNQEEKALVAKPFRKLVKKG